MTEVLTLSAHEYDDIGKKLLGGRWGGGGGGGGAQIKFYCIWLFGGNGK